MTDEEVLEFLKNNKGPNLDVICDPESKFRKDSFAPESFDDICRGWSKEKKTNEQEKKGKEAEEK